MKRNRSAGHAEKSDIGQRTPNAKHLLGRFTKMHRREQRTLMFTMRRINSEANVRYASSIGTLENASSEQSASLSMINITVQI